MPSRKRKDISQCTKRREVNQISFFCLLSTNSRRLQLFFRFFYNYFLCQEEKITAARLIKPVFLFYKRKKGLQLFSVKKLITFLCFEAIYTFIN